MDLDIFCFIPVKKSIHGLKNTNFYFIEYLNMHTLFYDDSKKI